MSANNQHSPRGGERRRLHVVQDLHPALLAQLAGFMRQQEQVLQSKAIMWVPAARSVSKPDWRILGGQDY